MKYKFKEELGKKLLSFKRRTLGKLIALPIGLGLKQSEERIKNRNNFT